MAPRYLPPDVADDVEQPPPQHRDAKYRVHARRCTAKTRAGKRCRRLATGFGTSEKAVCWAHLHVRNYHAKRKKAAMDALAARDMLEVAKIARTSAQIDLMSAAETGVKALHQLASGKDEDGNPVPLHVRSRAAEAIVRLSGTSLEKQTVEVTGKVEHRHTVEAEQVINGALDRYADASDLPVIEAEVVE